MQTFTIEECKLKIEKLMKLSESPNEHEAALAMSKAQKLMTEYNLSISEIIMDEAKPLSAIRDEIGEDIEDWEGWLASGIAEIFGVRMFNHISHRVVRFNRRQRKSIVFYGLPMDVEAVKATFTMLNSTINHLSFIEFMKMKMAGIIGNARGETLSIKRGWFMGCVERIVARVKEQRDYEMSQNVAITALVIRKKDIIREAMAKDGIRLTQTAPSKAAASATGYTMGQNAANNIALNRLVQ